jgi:hypothetical protein
MSEQFDASQIWSEAVSGEIAAEHDRTVEGLMTRPAALANAKLHAERELGRLVSVCNRVAWGSVPAELRAPAADETAALLERLGEEDRDKLTTEARNAARQRVLVAKMADAEAQCQARLEAEETARAEEQALYQEWAEFEAFDASEKMKRFDTWRASRRQ